MAASKADLAEDTSEKAQPVRLNFNLTQAESATLARLAKKHGKTKTTVLRDGIHLAEWLDEIRDRKATILVKEADGTLREIMVRW